jgi:hypothetical protein
MRLSPLFGPINGSRHIPSLNAIGPDEKCSRSHVGPVKSRRRDGFVLYAVIIILLVLSCPGRSEYVSDNVLAPLTNLEDFSSAP